MPTDRGLTVYVDLLNLEEVKSMLQDAATEIAALRAALEFYADPKHWESVEVEKISDVLSSWVSGAAVDGGARARAALGAASDGCHEQESDTP